MDVAVITEVKIVRLNSAQYRKYRRLKYGGDGCGRVTHATKEAAQIYAVENGTEIKIKRFPESAVYDNRELGAKGGDS